MSPTELTKVRDALARALLQGIGLRGALRRGLALSRRKKEPALSGGLSKN